MSFATWDPRGQYNRGDGVEQWGDWHRARRVFHGLGFKMQKASFRLVRDEAELVAARIRANLASQAYARSEPGHAPLSPETVANKVANEDKILVETEEFLHAIQVHQNGPRTWLVGVQGDERLVKRAAANEWGASAANTSRGQTIPERPVFRVEMERIRADGTLQKLPTAFRRIFEGRY